MSVLAGFDVGIEISRAALRTLVLRHFPLADPPGTPPPYEFRTGRGDVRGYLLIRDLDLELLPQERVALIVTFDNSTLHWSNRHACPLAGSLRLEVPVLLQPSSTGHLLGLDFASATAVITLDPASVTVVEKKFGLAIADVRKIVDTAVTQEVQHYGFQSLGIPLKVSPGVDGSLGTGSLSSTQFERVEVHCIAPPDRDRQALALLGTLFAANHALGNPADKTETVLEPGQAVALSLSDPAFRRFVFCEGLRQGLEAYLKMKKGSLGMAQIPGPCGGAGLSVDGVLLTQLNAALGEGVIQLSGAAETSGDCYEAWGNFTGQLSLWIQGNTLGATPLNLSTTVTVDPDEFCVLLGALVSVFSNPMAALADVLGGSLSDLFAAGGGSGAISGAVGSIMGKPFALLTLGDLQGVKFDEVRITPAALSLVGTWPMPFLPRREPWVDVPVQVTRVQVVAAGTGIYSVPAGCLKGDYAYEELLQDQVAVFQLLPSLFGDVILTDWWIDCGGTPQLLPPGTGSGNVTVPGVKTFYPLPLTGGSTVVQDVHLQYETTEERLVLRNVAAEGCFAVTVRPVLRNCRKDKLQVEAWAQFSGNVVELDGEYHARVTACLFDRVKDYLHHLPDYQIPPIVPVNYPQPEYLIGMLNQVMRMPAAERDQQLRDLITAHGPSFARALGAPPALRGSLAHLPTLSRRIR